MLFRCIYSDLYRYIYSDLFRYIYPGLYRCIYSGLYRIVIPTGAKRSGGTCCFLSHPSVDSTSPTSS